MPQAAAPTQASKTETSGRTGPSVGPRGLALAPPDYGIDVVDQLSASDDPVPLGSNPRVLRQKAFFDGIGNSPRVMQQTALRDQIASGPRAQRQKVVFDSVRNSSRVVAQRQRAEGLVNAPVQCRGMNELPGEPDAAPRVAAEATVSRRENSPGSPARRTAPEPQLNTTGLPNALKSGVESLSGLSLDNVRVHYNSSRPAQLNALAYARGSDIHLAPGQEQHLPHEAWHVIQQAQGRVKPTMQLKGGIRVNDDSGLEREADVMGAKALQIRHQADQERGLTGARQEAGRGAPDAASAPLRDQAVGSSVIQAKMGFELELLVLVDIDGRPVPEKYFLGTYGNEHLELQVDQNGQVEGPTPAAPDTTPFRVAANNPPPPTLPQWQDFNRYDLPQGLGFQSRMDAPPAGPPVVDPRTAGLNHVLLSPATWRTRTHFDRYTRPPAANNTGLNNAQLPALDAAINQYNQDAANWEPAAAVNQLNLIIAAANLWLGANNNNPPASWYDILGKRRNERYAEARATLQQLVAEATNHHVFWSNPANANRPLGMQRLYRRVTATTPNPAWSVNHPIAGMGTANYASILEIVTRPYEPETIPGRLGLVAAMTEAAQLANAIEVGTHNFANRIRFNTILNTNIFNANTYIGNAGPTRNPQSTDASIQTTFGVDLAQIASVMQSTIAFGAPQNQFSLKHAADLGPTELLPGGLNRAEREMVLAVRDATNVVNQIKAAIGGGAPSFVNLRGLLLLVCQYLRLGKYWTGHGAPDLDKNLTDLLSRTDLSHIYQQLVPRAEKVWLDAHLGTVIGWIFVATGRNQATVLLNNPNETRVGAGNRQFGITCQQFVNRVFTQGDDGLTQYLGGFVQRPIEDIDPAGARGGDTRPPGRAHRQAPVFEMRNMIPKAGPERFPSNTWVGLATYMAEMIELLNARTEAQATQDVRVQEQHAAPPLGHTAGLGNPAAPW